jgi:Protein of unknown function (DUF1214)
MTEPAELVAWRDLCRRLEQVGVDLASGGYPADTAEGLAHLTEQVVCWLAWSVHHGDARRPAFHRQNDLVTQWGGPNNENVYRHARIDPALHYRITGRMHSCEEFVLALRAGFMHEPQWGTRREVTASELGIGHGDEFELLLGPGSTIEIPEDVAMVSIREYYFDWQPEEPATMVIECLDEDGPAPPVEGSALAAQLGAVAASVERSMAYWNTYMLDARAAGVDNAFAASQRLNKGLAVARYAFCFWSLGPDEALVVESDLPASRYWSFQLYSLGWFEPLDPAGRITSRNHLQCPVDDDGKVRVVVAHRDPGVGNWLDTGGRREGLLTLRWFWPTGDAAPAPSATVVPLSDVTGTPADHGAEQAARRRHVAWRFRV